MPDFNRFVDNKSSMFPLMPNDAVNRLRNSTNAINRGLLGPSPKNQQGTALTHPTSSRKRITFGEDDLPSAGQSVGLPYNSSAFSSLFDSNNNPNHNQNNRLNAGTSNIAPFPKEEHDSPKNGVRKDVKLISDAAETEELFGEFFHVYGRFNRQGVTDVGVARQGLLAVTALNLISHHSLSSCWAVLQGYATFVKCEQCNLVFT